MRRFDWRRALTVARTDVRQLVLAKDFWLPMAILGSIFFVVVPTVLLFSRGSVRTARLSWPAWSWAS